MSNAITLNATTRTKLGSRVANRIRKENTVPAVVYGHKEATLPVAVNGIELAAAMAAKSPILTLVVDGKAQPCLIKSVQWDTFGRQIIHVDFARVDLNETITVKVNVVLAGDCAALKAAGSILLRPAATVNVSCKAKDIPSSVTLNISELAVGHSLFVTNLTLPAGVTCVDDAHTVLATISIGKEEEVAAPVAGAAGTAPEVIKKPGAKDEAAPAAGAAGAKPAAGAKAAAPAAKPAAKK